MDIEKRITNTPPISALISTRNRGDSIVPTIKSILANDYANFELLVIDQSDDDLTEKAIQPFLNNPFFSYKRTNTRGLSRGHNIGISEINNNLIAITDDDCEVAPNWLAEMVNAFTQNSRIGAVFGNVEAAEYDAMQGFIPVYERESPLLVTSMKQKNQARGIGACMGLRRDVWEAVHYFDEGLGTGGKFKAAGDSDFSLKVLMAGYFIYETPKVKVVHFGFRTHKQGRTLVFIYNYGTSAMYAKYLKCHRFSILPLLINDLGLTLQHLLYNLLIKRKLRGLTQVISFINGFIEGFLTPIDRYNNFSSPDFKVLAVQYYGSK